MAVPSTAAASTSAAPRPRRRWIRWVVAAAAGLLDLATSALIVYLVVYQTDLIFRPRHVLAMIPTTLGLAPEPVALRGANGMATVGWRIQAAGDSPYWIVFLHGNDATRASDGNVTRYHQLRALGLNILAPEYPGYADVSGEPSERGLIEAARAAYDALRRVHGVDGRRIAIYGWSLGTGGAVPLARDVDEAALIVEGAFSSVLRRAQAAYPYLPITWMMQPPLPLRGRDRRGRQPGSVPAQPRRRDHPVRRWPAPVRAGAPAEALRVARAAATSPRTWTTRTSIWGACTPFSRPRRAGR